MSTEQMYAVSLFSTYPFCLKLPLIDSSLLTCLCIFKTFIENSINDHTYNYYLIIYLEMCKDVSYLYLIAGSESLWFLSYLAEKSDTITFRGYFCF